MLLPLLGSIFPYFLSGRVLFLLYVTSSVRDILWASPPASIAFTEEYYSVLTCVLGPHPPHPPDRLIGPLCPLLDQLQEQSRTA